MYAATFKSPTPTNSGREFCQRTGNCILVTIAVVCVCVLVACGVLIVREYALSRNYVTTECVVANVTRGNLVPCTFCSVKKKGACSESAFPCLQILVSYSSGGRRYQGILHNDSLQARGKYKQVCTSSAFIH